MEIFAQWLDDLDDIVMALPLAWARLRVRCLQTGLLAAVVLAVTSTGQPPIVVAGVTSGVALGSVLLWTGAALIALGRRFAAPGRA
jgi:hypothetical protein